MARLTLEERETGSVVIVRRQWNDLATAEYRLSDVVGVHWDYTSGGVGARAPRQFMHAYVMCDAMISGAVSHSCRHGPPPHRIKVCIAKRDNTPAVLRALEDQMEKQMTANPPRPVARPKIDGRTAVELTAQNVLRMAPNATGNDFVKVIGLTQPAAEALVAHGVDCRERLLFMSLDEIKSIPGIGKVAIEKIRAYRSRFLPSDAAE